VHTLTREQCAFGYRDSIFKQSLRGRAVILDVTFALPHNWQPQLDYAELAKELSNNHGYITASINEPGGNHQNEGALCGLPLLYRFSGCMPEYCNGYGVSFNESNFVDKLNEFYESYEVFSKQMSHYPHTASVMTANYLKYFNFLLENKKRIVSERDLKKNLINLYRLYFPI
jgi:hypothetical protein